MWTHTYKMKMSRMGFDILFNSVHPNVFSSFIPFESTVHLTVAHQVLRRPSLTPQDGQVCLHSPPTATPSRPQGLLWALRVSVIPFCWPGTIQATVGRLTNKRQGVEPKVGCTYLMALLGVHSGGRSPGQELRTHLLGGADPCNTASSQESAENVFSL